MNINIASAVEEMLDRRETVTLVGIGSIRLENLSAKISKDGKLIKPPRVKLSFYDVQTDNKALHKYLAYKYKLTKKEADKAIKKFSQSVMNSLANYGEVNLKGIAKIKSSNGSYKIKALDSFKEKYYHGLPTLGLTELKEKEANVKTTPKGQAATDTKSAVSEILPKPSTSQPAVSESVKNEVVKTPAPPKPAPLIKVEQETKKEVVKKEPAKSVNTVAPKQPTPKSDTKVKPASNVVSPKTTSASPIERIKSTAATTIITEKSQPLSLNEKLALQSKPTSAATPTAVPSKTKHSTMKTTTIKPATDKAPYVPVPPKEEKFGCFGPFLGLVGILLLCFLIWKGMGCILATGSEKLPSATESIVTATNELSETVTDVASDVATEAAELKDGVMDAVSTSATAVASESKNCIIIIGSFYREDNVDRTKRVIIDNGYDIYIERSGSYTRVGFEFDCADTDLPSYLRSIRTEFGTKAWYLEPDLYVAY